MVFAVREMSGTEYWPLLNLYWSDKGIWYGHQRWLLENHGKKKFITIVRQFHDSIHAELQDKGESSVAFSVTNGIKQRCVLAQTLFSIMFSAMLFDVFSGSKNGIDIRFRTNGSVFNLRRFQAKTKVKTDIVNEFLFADDCALNAITKAHMQNIVDKFSMACDNFGLTFSTKWQKWCTIQRLENHTLSPTSPSRDNDWR